MKKTFLSISSVFLIVSSIYASEKPKLIIGVVVDQMRPDYLDLYFSGKAKVEQKGGFMKLQQEGLVFSNAFLGYMPSYTGPGHASIYTGGTPAKHGIIANNWYSRDSGKMIYCVDDDNYKGVGGSLGKNNNAPTLLLSPTLGDRMKEANPQAKVIGIALKDRASILPAGKKADMAYWFDGKAGNWVSSTYYCKELPQWVNEFNKRKLVYNYLKTPWSLLYPLNMYLSSLSDDNPYESVFYGEEKPVFPHDIAKLASENGASNIIKSTPFGNNFTAEFAKTAIINEQLGQDEVTDLLTISFSSTDYVGHMYGPGSLELEDTYYRFNYVMDDLINFLDEQIGKENYLLFLTADHGVQLNPQYAKDSFGIEADFFDTEKATKTLEAELKAKYGVANLIDTVYNYQVYLNRDLIEAKSLSLDSIKMDTKAFFSKQKGIEATYSSIVDIALNMSNIAQIVSAGILEERSGDVFFVLNKGWIELSEYGKTGTTHGSPYADDTQVPLLFYGWNIKPGVESKTVGVTNVVPAIWDMLGIKHDIIYTNENLVRKSIIR